MITVFEGGKLRIATSDSSHVDDYLKWGQRASFGRKLSNMTDSVRTNYTNEVDFIIERSVIVFYQRIF